MSIKWKTEHGQFVPGPKAGSKKDPSVIAERSAFIKHMGANSQRFRDLVSK